MKTWNSFTNYLNDKLTLLLTNLTEDEILVSNIPNFYYYDDNNRKHKYYPDIYIKNTNLIIEVKTTYIYNKVPRINFLKFKHIILRKHSRRNVKLFVL